MDLFTAPALRYEQGSAQPHFTITGPDGVPLARADQVAGQRKGTLSRWLGGLPGGGSPRLCLAVTRPDGALLHYVDRPDFTPPPGTVGHHAAPVYLVSPDGTALGRLDDDKSGFRGTIGQGVPRLLDAWDRPAAQVVLTYGGRRYMTEGDLQADDGRRAWNLDAPDGAPLAELTWQSRFSGGGTFDLRFTADADPQRRAFVLAFPLLWTLRNAT
ncbi:hypothetical protein [Actinomadura flavalba]|uniref:hypothetical protein n=1 Tax=Actinomadura flavalba TaxID=1120938 RepID=UPI00035EB0A3|nr:hypothetical protein [Actinomadura flavalba]